VHRLPGNAEPFGDLGLGPSATDTQVSQIVLHLPP